MLAKGETHAVAPGRGLEVQIDVEGKSQHVKLYQMEVRLTSKGKHNASAIDPIPVRAPSPKDIPIAA